MTLKEHVAIFPDGSLNVYSTSVDPKGKPSPGFADRVELTDPESSVADGSVQTTEMSLDPTTASTSISDGHPTITGSMLSRFDAEENHEISVHMLQIYNIILYIIRIQG